MGKKSRQKKEKRIEDDIEDTKKSKSKTKAQRKISKKIVSKVASKNNVAKKSAKSDSKKSEPQKKSSDVDNSKEKSEKKTQSKQSLRQRAKGFTLILIGILLLGFSGALLYNRLFRPTELAAYLPAQETVALFEFDMKGAEFEKLKKALDPYPVYNRSNLLKKISMAIDAEYESAIEPWIGRHAGLALLKISEMDNEKGNGVVLSPIVFVEVTNFDEAFEFFAGGKDGSTTKRQQKDDVEFYATELEGQNIFFAFIDNYFVASINSQSIVSLIQGVKTSDGKLKDSPKYKRVTGNLPTDNLAFAYFDVSNISSYILDSPNLGSESGMFFASFEPFLKAFESEGVTINAMENSIEIRTFTGFDRNLLKGKDPLVAKQKYRANLAKYIDQDAMIVWGGMDMQKQLKRIADILARGSEASLIIFDGMLEAQKQIFVGQEVSLYEDIYPLVANEFIIAIYDGDMPAAQVVIELKDGQDDLARVEKIIDGFVRENAVFRPEVRDIVLEDGTVGQEIIGIPEEALRADIDYQGKIIHSVTIGSKPWGIYYIVQDGKLILASSRAIIENVLDGKQVSLASSDDFKKTIEPILSHADEMSYMNLKKLLPKFLPNVEGGGETSIMQLYLDPFKSISTSNNYFTDGISTIHQISLQ